MLGQVLCNVKTFFAADELGSSGVAKILIDRGAEPECSRTPINIAVEHQNQVEVAATGLNVETYKVWNWPNRSASYYHEKAYGDYSKIHSVLPNNTIGWIQTQKPSENHWHCTRLDNLSSARHAVLAVNLLRTLPGLNTLAVLIGTAMCEATTFQTTFGVEFKVGCASIAGAAKTVHRSCDICLIEVDHVCAPPLTSQGGKNTFTLVVEHLKVCHDGPRTKIVRNATGEGFVLQRNTASWSSGPISAPKRRFQEILRCRNRSIQLIDAKIYGAQTR